MFYRKKAPVSLTAVGAAILVTFPGLGVSRGLSNALGTDIGGLGSGQNCRELEWKELE